ncbi:hypothetical protein [Flavisolibacter nicotianae]|uniref:hypothetical protein n=1 Tax=Flavisolibacter nicotianae TaxID=2364882 RepID=UPI000EAD5D9C|nr:hypothetical protein [Flavisolibacter nicotianae]
MPAEQTNNSPANQNENNLSAPTGNASNPSPQENNFASPGRSQLLGKEAETYLREAGNIEDLPDANDQAEADDTTKRESKL